MAKWVPIRDEAVYSKARALVEHYLLTGYEPDELPDCSTPSLVLSELILLGVD